MRSESPAAAFSFSAPSALRRRSFEIAAVKEDINTCCFGERVSVLDLLNKSREISHTVPHFEKKSTISEKFEETSKKFCYCCELFFF